MYYAKGLKELIFEVELSMDFFENLDEFHLAYIEHCFELALEENMGLMNEVGRYNQGLLEEYKSQYLENIYFVEFDKKSKNKKSAA